MITQERLRELVSYDPDTGLLTCLVRRGQRGAVGKVEVRLDMLGYRIISLDFKRYRQHRLVWLYIYGEWPRLIDHIDGNRSNNRLSNLRLATHKENVRSQRRSKANKSGIKGVYLEKWTGKWCAEIRVDMIRHRLGRFDNIEEAGEAYAKAAKKHFGEFARMK